MTARALEELDTGLGSLQAAVVSRRADASSWPLDLAAEGSLAGGADVGPKKTAMEPDSQMDPGLGKEKLRAAPRSPARRKAQPAPPSQPPPPPPPPREQPLWGSLSLNKCLVVASFVALLGSGFQLCRDAVIGVANAPAPGPGVSPSSAPKKPEAPAPAPGPGVPPSSAPKKPEAPAAPVLQEARPILPPPPAPAAGTEEREDAAGSGEAAEKEEEDIAEPAGEEEDSAPLLAPERKEKRKKEQAPRRERPRQERPRRDSGLREEKKPRAAREPRRAREPDPRPRARASGDPEPRKRPAWASRHHPDEEDRRLGRKHRVGKGRD